MMKKWWWPESRQDRILEAMTEIGTTISEPGEEERRRGKPLLQGKLEEMGWMEDGMRISRKL